MPEKALLAYFSTPEQAEEALRQLRSLRLVDSAIERIDGFSGDGFGGIVGNPVTGRFPGLGSLTLNGDFDNPDAAVLAAANVSASGMSSGSPDNRVTGVDILLTAIVNEEDFEQAQTIVQQAGAK